MARYPSVGRLRTYFVGQLVAVASLAGFWAVVTRYGTAFTHLDRTLSGPVALATVRLLPVAFAILPAAALAGPRVFGLLSRDGPRRRYADPTLAVLLAVGAGLGALQFVVPLYALYLLVPAAVLLAVLVGLAVHRIGSGRPSTAGAEALYGVALTGLVVAAAFGGGYAGATAGETLTAEFSTPPVALSVSHESAGDGVGRLTFRHEGGSAVGRDRLRIAGTGFADVGGVDQTSGGPWRGEASGSIGDAAAVQQGDAVTVGVTDECVVRVVYAPDGTGSNGGAVFEVYECGSE